jgi:hypothetical protein
MGGRHGLVDALDADDSIGVIGARFPKGTSAWNFSTQPNGLQEEVRAAMMVQLALDLNVRLWAINANRVAKTKMVVVNAIPAAMLGWPHSSPARSQRRPFEPASTVKWQQ